MNTLATYFLSLIAALLISLFLFEIGVSMQVQALNAGFRFPDLTPVLVKLKLVKFHPISPVHIERLHILLDV